MRTEFQDKLIKICSGDSTFTEKEQAFIDEYFGPPLTENQIRDMNYRHHLHLTEDEKGEGLKAIKEHSVKRELPHSFDCLFDERIDLNNLWKIYCKLIWWHNFNHKTVEEKWWNYGEKLLKRGPKTRRANYIDYVESVKQRRIILTE